MLGSIFCINNSSWTHHHEKFENKVVVFGLQEQTCSKLLKQTTKLLPSSIGQKSLKNFQYSKTTKAERGEIFFSLI